MLFMGNSRDDYIRTTRKLLEWSAMVGIEVDQQKPEYMYISQTNADESDLRVGNLIF